MVQRESVVQSAPDSAYHSAISKELAETKPDGGLPMPHNPAARGRAGAAEKAEYARRRQVQCERQPAYAAAFNRPPPKVFKKAWKLIKPWLPKQVEIVKAKSRRLRKLKLHANEQLALVVLVDLFINAARSGRGVTYNEVFDEVCRKFSDHFVASLASQSRDMMPATVKNARRDLLCNDIDINKLWAIFRRMSMPDEQFFSIAQVPTKDPSTRLQATLINGPAVDEFTRLVARTPWFFSSRNRGVRLAIVSEGESATADDDDIFEPKEFCAEVPYNRAQPGARTRNSIKHQAQAILLFDVDTFKADFAKATELETELRRKFLKKYKFDPRMPNKKIRMFRKKGRGGAWVKTEIWSQRERFIYYNSIVEGFKRPLYSTEITKFYRKKRARVRNEKSHPERKRQRLALKQRYQQFVVWLVDGCVTPIGDLDLDPSAYPEFRAWQRGLCDLIRSRRSAVKQEYERRWQEFIRTADLHELASAEQNADVDEESSDDDSRDDETVDGSEPLKQAEIRKRERSKRFEIGRAFLKEVRAASRTSGRNKGLTRQDVIRASIAGWQWRRSVRAAVCEYDNVRDFLRLYRAAYSQLEDCSGLVPIRSRFYIAINRRYQPRDMWPTYVGDWSDDNAPERHYRKRWFRARDPEQYDRPCRLVGFDISSSQTQITAVLLGIEPLERLALDAGPNQRPFKETLAGWAFKKHRDPKDKFKLRSVRRGLTLKRYTGAKDRRLQDLCKSLWMKISYGSTVSEVVRDQDGDPRTYGPGWTWQNAQRFLNYLQNRFKGMKLFLDACEYIGQQAAKSEGGEGAIFTDPTDKTEVRWHPLKRKDRRLKSDSHTLILSLPAAKGIKDTFQTGEGVSYDVDGRELSKMIAPCLIHMLDAHYSTLVMEKLVARGVRDFVGIHDCWLVPERVFVDQQLCHGADVLREVMKEADRDWFNGLGPIYTRLRHYLGHHQKFELWIKKAEERWLTRKDNGYVPAFLAKSDG